MLWFGRVSNIMIVGNYAVHTYKYMVVCCCVCIVELCVMLGLLHSVSELLLCVLVFVLVVLDSFTHSCTIILCDTYVMTIHMNNITHHDCGVDMIGVCGRIVCQCFKQHMILS